MISKIDVLGQAAARLRSVGAVGVPGLIGANGLAPPRGHWEKRVACPKVRLAEASAATHSVLGSPRLTW